MMYPRNGVMYSKTLANRTAPPHATKGSPDPSHPNDLDRDSPFSIASLFAL